ncbi:SDR family NAD(P)-dependent oxidoreductase [Undibacterium fentianense]|uniref:SDR family oxidoreductase n=1 Tax=Undibacterium fentianense TaxID=2828728 RepID=A0A941E456_9BURK|nr:SDR family oxidoreductase [Undibacterium fentianense]MBR7800787.1 SDR family oxidoreductase [Undibacterium fentianense]
MNQNVTASSPTIALITGGSRGLGKNAALHLARQGVDIIFTYQRQQEAAQALVQQLQEMGRKAVALQLDVGKVGSFPAFVQELRTVLRTHWQTEQIAMLLNNAGMGIHRPFMEITEDDFDQLMNVHLKAVFFLTQQVLPILRDGGRILNISSGLTRFALPGYSAYAAMKGAVEVLTPYLAKELGSRGISVNVLAPGAIETDFGHGAVRDNAQLNQFVASQTALGRAGQPDDIGAVVAALLAQDTQWINGQRIEASGGMFL